MEEWSHTRERGFESGRLTLLGLLSPMEKPWGNESLLRSGVVILFFGKIFTNTSEF